MPDTRQLPLLRWGEELRRDRLARRKGRIRTVATAGAAVAAVTAVCAVGATLVWPTRPVLVWNRSESSPVGLYHVAASGEVGAGDMVVAWPPKTARRLAAERHYLPFNIPLVKRVAAARGDRVCAAGEAVFVNATFVTRRRRADSNRRPLPWWTGCETLEEGETLLLMPGASDSFDGRYFGVTQRRHLIGRARLIWPG